MTTYYIENRHEGYVVCRLSTDNGYQDIAPLVCFGDRQSDAIEFCDACRRDVIRDARINALARGYMAEPKSLDYANRRYNLHRVK